MTLVSVCNVRLKRPSSIAFLFMPLVVTVCLECVAQPDWVPTFGRSVRFNDSIYVTGFGIAQADNSADVGVCSERALSTARRNLAEKVRISLQNRIISHQVEINQTLSQYFSATSQAVSVLDIDGLKTENYHESARNVWYALAYVRRDDLARTYSRKIEILRVKLSDLLKTGTKSNSSGDRERALKALTSCYPLLRDLDQCKGILLALESEKGEIPSPIKTGYDRDRLTVESLEKATAAFLKKPITSIDDAAHLAVFLLKEQLSQDTVLARVDLLTYQDAGAVSSFSRYFRQMLETQLTTVAGWRVDARNGLHPSQAPDVLSIRGTYWEQNEGLKVLLSVYRDDLREVVAAGNIVIPHKVISKSGFRTKPENLQQVVADQKEFIRQDLSPVGLNLEVWTDKGSVNPLFAKGDRMGVYVRLNNPAYVRFVYHLADGRRALLLDNYLLPDKEVNQAYRIPHEFECAPPFGVEVLQVFARTEPFDKVSTKSVEGYDIITDDLGKFLVTTRGMKSVKQPVMQAESRIVLTTVSQ